ncbi:hypothetical protein GLOIN_2v1482942 [Rhizophagus irregularis DAOM 181602=DAOM 197198]|nr:hypothetical protein GLOIN_2v1482942 [Rhizophagus irregularis DAOM 181602=DAOM 197198]
MEITKLENSNRELEVDVTVKERTNLEKEEEIRELEKKKEIDTSLSNKKVKDSFKKATRGTVANWDSVHMIIICMYFKMNIIGADISIGKFKKETFRSADFVYLVTTSPIRTGYMKFVERDTEGFSLFTLISLGGLKVKKRPPSGPLPSG